ncbi:MAG: hypothetical protein KKA07_15030 [Bacteroidetes bacterium]|nr:hypothetical protein [Bacteroidota bacterium]MBU1720375.1 hypothetical protein [Bacteroidota bacterium]
MKIYLIVCFAAISASSCTGTSSTQENSTNSLPADTTKYVYHFQNKYLDVNNLSYIDSSKAVNYSEVVRENFHVAHFFGGEANLTAVYEGLTYELLANRDIRITTSSGKVIRTVKDPDKGISTDNVSGNSVLFATSTGIISAIRLSDDNGYHIRKYDPAGNILNTWTVKHTLYNVEGNTVESIPFIYYFAHSDDKMIFSSIYSGKQQTVILDLDSGMQQTTPVSTGGIIVNSLNNKLAGLIHFNEDRRTMQVDLGEKKWEIENASYGDAAKTILSDSILVMAMYHNIATGCMVNAYNAETGKLIWKGDVKQLNVGHSKYYNVVHLTLCGQKLILEGNEAYGSYLQVLDLKTGKRLFEDMPGE